MPEIAHRAMNPWPASSEDLGRWLWGMQDCRERTKQLVTGLSIDQLDWVANAAGNSVGSVLYHIALIECDYLCIDILGMDDYFVDLKALLPWEDRDTEGNLTATRSLPLENYLSRLDAVRSRFLEIVAPMNRDPLTASRLFQDWKYDITPEWTVYHMIQHEAEHRGEIGSTLSYLKSNK